MVSITKGLVYKVEFDFPPGSAGLLGCAIFDGSYQVWPSSLGNWFTGDDVVISFDDVYLKESAPYNFTIVTYNEDDTYDHLINIRIGLVSKKIFMGRFLPSIAYEDFAALLAQVNNDQIVMAEEQKQQIIDQPFSWSVE